jgi:hypothetical protein
MQNERESKPEPFRLQPYHKGIVIDIKYSIIVKFNAKSKQFLCFNLRNTVYG